jgi:hypothetical protein
VSRGQFRVRAYLGGLLALIAGMLAFDRAHTRPGRTLARGTKPSTTTSRRTYSTAGGCSRFTRTPIILGIRDPFLHKPPLVYWIDAVSMGLFDETVASARLTTAVATALIVALIVGIAVREAGIFAGVRSGLAVGERFV